MKQRLVQAASEGLVRLVINLADVTVIDRAGLAALISGLKAAHQGGGDLRLACPGREVENILEFTRLDRVIQRYATVGEALARYATGEDGGV